MNPTYRRYLTDEAFRVALLGAVNRERAQAMARFFAATAAYFWTPGRSHATRAHLARQG